MKKLQTLSLLAMLATVLSIPAPADAATANFQGNFVWGSGTTNPKPFFGVLDAGRPSSSPSSCSPSFIQSYFWDFGDGASTFGFSFVAHSYAQGTVNPLVYLAVFCANGDTATRARFIDSVVGTGGIRMGDGWT